jgi:hypothetical protein
MCEPITISTGAAWALGASAAVTAAATYVSYQGNKNAGEVSAAIAENNAKLAAADAENAMAMGDRETEQQAWRTRAILGQQRAAIASRGIDPGMGTPLDLLGETAMFGEVDQQTIRLNAARNAWGFRAQETNIRNQSALDRYTTKQRGTATILSGLSSMGGSAYSMYGG